MPDPDVKKNAPLDRDAQIHQGRRDAIRTGDDLYGDESDPRSLRPKKKDKKPAKQKQKKKRTANKAKANKHGLPSLSKATQYVKSTPFLQVVREEHQAERNRANGVYLLGKRLPLYLLIALGVLFTFLVIVFFNNGNLNVQEQVITAVGLNEDLEGYRMLVLSDLNGRRFGDRQSALLRTISNTSYDVVFCLGDMVGKGGDPEPFYELLEGLPSSKQVYFICGDNDPGPFVDKPRQDTDSLSGMVLEDWILGAIERNAVYVDRPMMITVGTGRIWLDPSDLMNIDATSSLNTWKEQTEQEEQGTLSGLETDHDTLPITTYRYRLIQRMYEAIDSMHDDDYYIALAHQVPSKKSILSASRHTAADGKFIKESELILAGHYCGGVWHLPAIGAFYVPDDTLPRHGWFPAQEEAYGLSSVGRTQVFITSGLSTNGDIPLLFVRLFNQPQISVLTLTATLPENMLSAE